MSFRTLLILHVGDDAEMRDLIALCLATAEDMTLTSLDSGPAALEHLKAAPPPHLILLDVCMPEMDGPATLAALRGLDGLAETPVVFLTGRAAEHECARYRALGAADVIAKPFDPARLADDIRRHAA